MPKKDRPDEEGIAFFIHIMNIHNQVLFFDHLSYQMFSIQRRNGGDIVVYLSDLYTIGMADYLNIRNKHNEVNCIVTASGYNSYTDDAKEQARSDEIGLFTAKEFMGALHHEKFWNYVRNKKDGPVKFRGERSA